MEKYALIISVISLFISFVFGLRTFLRDRVNSLNAHITEIDRIIIEYPELLYIYDKKKLNKILNKKGEIFRNKIWAFIDLHFNIFENTYLQYLSFKFLFKKDKKMWDNFILLIFESDTVQKRWNKWKKEEVYDKNFITYVDNLVNKKVKMSTTVTKK